MMIPNDYKEFYEETNNLIDISLNKAQLNNSENLENEILNYIHVNYPAMVIPKGYILEIINNCYKPGTDKYKQKMEFKAADIKYKLESIETENKIQEDIEDLNKLFETITMGTNFCYFGYIENTLNGIMKYLIDISRGSMSFAKNSIKIRESIMELITKYYKITMKEYGENLKTNFERKLTLYNDACIHI